jgi:enediyne biosynthesis protein E4
MRSYCFNRILRKTRVCRWGLCLGLVLASEWVSQPPTVNFVDIATQAGLSKTLTYGGERSQDYLLESTGTGVAVIDFDNDGHPDLFFVNGTRFKATPQSNNLLYRNQGNGTFEDVSDTSGIADSGWGQAVCTGDFDNDGWTDLFVTYYGTNKLYRNKGDGIFADVAPKAGVAGSQPRWNSGCTFLDYDNDGYLDLFVANYVAYEDAAHLSPGSNKYCLLKGTPVMCGPTGLKAGTNMLYHNNRDGTFSDVSAASHIADPKGRYSLQPITADFDEDGRTDIFVACDATPNILYRNNGDGTFEDKALEAGVAFDENGRAEASMGVDVADYDGNQSTDLFVTSFSDETPTLYRNEGKWSFSDVTFRARLGHYTRYVGWSALFLDFDLDGWKDLFIVNGHIYPQVDHFPSGLTYHQNRQLYRNRKDGTFEDLTERAGPGILRRTAGRGAAAEDFDADGQLEMVVTNMNDTPSLLRNHSGTKNNWIIIQLVGQKSNRSGIGARVELTANGLSQKGEVRSSSGYYSSSGQRLHFGLGASRKLDKLTVSWPSGKRDSVTAVGANQVLLLREGEGSQ